MHGNLTSSHIFKEFQLQMVNLTNASLENRSNIITSDWKNMNVKCNYKLKPEFDVTALVISLVIIILNLTVVFFITKSKLGLRKSPVNFILLSFAINGILSGLSIVLHIFPNFYFHARGCLLHDSNTFRNINDSGYLISKLTLLCCIGHIILLSSEQMVSAFCALRYKVHVTKTRTLKAICSIWMITLFLTLTEFACFKLLDIQLTSKIYTVILVLTFVLIPSIILCLQYVSMLTLINKLAQHCPPQRKHLQKNRKAILIYSIMYLFFMFLCLPFFIIRVVIAFHGEIFDGMSTSVLQMIFLMRYLTAIINPLIYTFLKKDFRNAFVKFREESLFRHSEARSRHEKTHCSQELLAVTAL